MKPSKRRLDEGSNDGDDCPPRKKTGLQKLARQPVAAAAAAAAKDDKNDNDSTKRMIDMPLARDVLLGRGKPYQSHQGNQRMRDIVDQHKARYCSAPRDQRRPLAEDVLDEVTKDGARFLKRLDESELWVEVERCVAVDKISHALRGPNRASKHDEKRNATATPGQSNTTIDESDSSLTAQVGVAGLVPLNIPPSPAIGLGQVPGMMLPGMYGLSGMGSLVQSGLPQTSFLGIPEIPLPSTSLLMSSFNSSRTGLVGENEINLQLMAHALNSSEVQRMNQIAQLQSVLRSYAISQNAGASSESQRERQD